MAQHNSQTAAGHYIQPGCSGDTASKALHPDPYRKGHKKVMSVITIGSLDSSSPSVINNNFGEGFGKVGLNSKSAMFQW